MWWINYVIYPSNFLTNLLTKWKQCFVGKKLLVIEHAVANATWARGSFVEIACTRGMLSTYFPPNICVMVIDILSLPVLDLVGYFLWTNQDNVDAIVSRLIFFLSFSISWIAKQVVDHFGWICLISVALVHEDVFANMPFDLNHIMLSLGSFLDMFQLWHNYESQILKMVLDMFPYV